LRKAGSLETVDAVNVEIDLTEVEGDYPSRRSPPERCAVRT
jgi:hypothetical protein